MKKKPSRNDFLLAKYNIDKFLIVAMELKNKTVSFRISKEGAGNKCPLEGETLKEIMAHYEHLYFDWSDNNGLITLTWA